MGRRAAGEKACQRGRLLGDGHIALPRGLQVEVWHPSSFNRPPVWISGSIAREKRSASQ